MSFLSAIKKQWAEAALTSSIEGVVREAKNGDALAVQKWYFKLKKEVYKQSVSSGINPADIEAKALTACSSELRNDFVAVVEKLSQPGGALAEVNTWLQSNDPV